jgi:hypothetical protein
MHSTSHAVLMLRSPIQAGDEGLRLDAIPGESVRARDLSLVADVRRAPELTQRFPRVLGRADLAHLELARPEGAAELRLLVPVILRRHADQLRLGSGSKVQQVMRPRERRPAREVRRGTERRVLIVGEVVQRNAAADHEGIEAARFDGSLGGRAEGLDVIAVGLGSHRDGD